MLIHRSHLLLLAAVLLAPLAPMRGAPALDEPSGDFAAWLSALKAEAIERGHEPETVAAALSDARPVRKVIQSDRSQPKQPRGFCAYMEKRLTPTRIERGRRELAQHAALLSQIREQYGVPPRYLVALWGLETNFGDYMGDQRTMDALVTLAYDKRRGDQFRAQIFGALQMIDEGHVPLEGWKASWAGASGHVQFMPTTYLRYAVDQDGDGRKDIWTSVPDALGSAANFLRQLGWRSGEIWGRQVAIPASLAGGHDLSQTRAIAEWHEAGVRRLDGQDLPAASLHGSVVLPRRTPDTAFLVYPNYRTFMRWNRSTFFAVSVGTLADELGERSSAKMCGLSHLETAANGPAEGRRPVAPMPSVGSAVGGS